MSFTPPPVPELFIAFNYQICLSSPHLWQFPCFPAFSWPWHFGRLLINYFVGCFSSTRVWGSSDVSHHLTQFMHFEEDSHRNDIASSSVCHVRVMLGDTTLDHLGEMESARFLRYIYYFALDYWDLQTRQMSCYSPVSEFSDGAYLQQYCALVGVFYLLLCLFIGVFLKGRVLPLLNPEHSL